MNVKKTDHTLCTYKVSVQNEFACDLLNYLTVWSADHKLCICMVSAQNVFACVLLNYLNVRNTDHKLCMYKASAQNEFECDVLNNLSVRSIDHTLCTWKISHQCAYTYVLEALKVHWDTCHRICTGSSLFAIAWCLLCFSGHYLCHSPHEQMWLLNQTHQDS